MHHFLKAITSSLLIITATLSGGQTATYPEPEITRIMFHVDKLPIDQDKMKEVANDLAILASKNANEDQELLYRNARLLALALRLNPKNEKAKYLNDRFHNKARIDEVDSDRYQHAIKKNMQLVRVLSRVDNNADTQRFVAYLKDALVGIATNDPQMKGHQVKNERWKDVLKEVVSRKQVNPKPVAEPEVNIPAEPGSLESDSKTDSDIESKDLVRKWSFLSSTIKTPVILSKQVGAEHMDYWHITDFKMTWYPKVGKRKIINLEIKPEYGSEKLSNLEAIIMGTLTHTLKDFPSAKVKVELPDKYSGSSGTLGLLPIVTQLYASLKNTSIPAGVHMIGQLNSKGEIYSDHLLWSQLKQLRMVKDMEQTLFCPMSADKALSQLVTLEESHFFVRNEVILVKDLDDVIKYLGGISDQNRKLAHEKFIEIRNSIGSRSVGAFSVDKKIRASLEEIIMLNPYHFSARMILLRGDTKRPRNLDPYFVAEEFKSLVHSLKEVHEGEYSNFDVIELANEADAIDAQLKAVERYIDRNEDEMVDALEKMSAELNNMARVMKKMSFDYNERSVSLAHDRFRKHYMRAEKFIEENQK